jgi:hypothetical protein
MTFMSKHQCSYNVSRWMASMPIPYEPMKSKFHMTIIGKLWPVKFMMHAIAAFMFGGKRSQATTFVTCAWTILVENPLTRWKTFHKNDWKQFKTCSMWVK